jgi:hypothetical protein
MVIITALFAGLAKQLLLAAELLCFSAQSRRYSPEVVQLLLARLDMKTPAKEAGWLHTLPNVPFATD